MKKTMAALLLLTACAAIQEPEPGAPPVLPVQEEAAPVMRCFPHDQFAAALLRRYQESPVVIGTGGNGQWIMELYASPTGSWTVTRTGVDRITCLEFSGEGLFMLPLPKADQGNPT